MASKKREERNKLIPSYCELCGYDKYVTKHRIRPGSKGGRYRPGNVIGLCPNCHIESDLGWISPLVLFQVVFARIRENNSVRNKNGSS